MPDPRPPLVLASSSPRRRDLLGRFGIAFSVVIPAVDESLLPGETPRDHVERLAGEKALAVARRGVSGLVVGADTVVVLDGRVIGKPADAEDARRMLGEIAGKTHRVYSGVAAVEPGTGKVRTVVACSEVTLRPIDGEEIRRYVATGEPLDKAGAYAVQGEGGKYVTGVKGSLTNVIGLPLRELHGLLNRTGLTVDLPEGRL